MTQEAAQTAAFAVGWDPDRVASSRIPYSEGGADLLGYLAYDNSTLERRPAVAIIPDWDGIGPYEEWRAHLLATLGYTALVTDIYSTAVVQGPSLPIQQRQALSQQYSSNPDLYVARIQAALDTIRDLDVVDPTQIAVIGYCLGGSGIIQLHRSYPNGTDGVLGVAGFHAGIPSKYVNEAVPNNPIRATFFNGYNDQGNDPVTVAEFQAALNATNATWSFEQLGQTVHAFTEPTMQIVATNTPQANSGYNPISDVASWWALRGFLRDIFGIANTTNPYTEDVMAAEDISPLAS
ncbi:hypothetical protein WJX73_007257 [Symbiochloris irregularis]|uniref:Dienelactone hydrolase domain-containing protein n=1 Tax=Symbiochloris irregularis TaxID=706552 RepID=A0AAW1NWR3_9CHLO